MKIIFFGTPDYVLPILDTLYKYHEIVAVVTQSPKPVGREQKIEYSAVDTWAHKKKVHKQFTFDDLPEADLGICASFGMIIPQSVINHFPFGILNIHPSLLPKYRGASPIQSQIADGVTQTGVTIIKMDEKMDHGPIVTVFKDEITPTDTFETLRTRLFERSAQILAELIEPYSKGKITLKPQDHSQATFTKMVSKQDGHVDLKNDSAELIERKLRAYSPWPGIWTLVKLTASGQQTTEKRLKILKLAVDRSQSPISIVPEIVQLEGKKPVDYKVFKSAYPNVV
jgi:methionyl-tRNA formyltransferase